MTLADRRIRNAWLEDALLRAKEQCRDDHGRFAACGMGDDHERRHRRQAAGKHRRQKRRRKVRGREHAGWIRHFWGEDRELGRDIKRERRQLRREQRKERKEQRRDARRAIRDMHREYPRSGSRRGSETRWNVADQIRNDRAALREDHAAARAQQRADHQSTVESHHRTQRESHAEVLRQIRDERGEGKGWHGKAVSPKGEIPGAHDLATGVIRKAGLLVRWREGTLTGRQTIDLMHALRSECRAILRGWATDLAESLNPDYERPTKGLAGAAKAAVGRFFGKVRGFIREAFVAGVLTLTHPHFDVETNSPVNEAVAAAVAEQETYLEAFEREILTEEKPLDGTFAARAEMYGAATWAAPQEILRQAAKRSLVFDQERRIHYGPDDAPIKCNVCINEERKEWQPIGTLRSIGDSPCKNNCHCAFSYRKGDDGVVHQAGRGPLAPEAFGGRTAWPRPYYP